MDRYGSVILVCVVGIAAIGHSMKGIILAGGTGSRLRPITYNTAKQLIPLGTKSVIERAILNLRDSGITDIGIIIGNNSPERIKQELGNGSDLGVDITYILQGEPLGLAHAVGCAQKYVGDTPFVVYFGDTVISSNITEKLLDGFDPNIHDAGIPLQRVDDPSRFGIAELSEDGTVQRVLEKPDDPPSNLAYVGAVAFSPSFFDIVESLEPSDRGELELTEAIDQYVQGNRKVVTVETDGIWRDVGTPEDVIETNRLLLDRIERDVRGDTHSSAVLDDNVILGEGSTVESRAVVHGPSVIGNDTTIASGSEVGPYVTVGDDCTLDATGIESSVIFTGANINISKRLVNSIVGRDSTLVDSGDETVSCELGWDSQVSL
jgi:glucose-1-phosphate thymidylyltransferase